MGRIKKVQSSKFKVQSLSFTLIETIIVVAIIGLSLPILFTIIFVILQQQTKLIRIQQVKSEGDFIMASMKQTIRSSARQIYSDQALSTEECSSGGSSFGPQNGQTFYFKDSGGKWFNYYFDNNNISSASAKGTANLNSTKVIINNFTIKCTRQNVYSPAIISLHLDLSYYLSSSRPEESANNLIYNTNIKLKNY